MKSEEKFIDILKLVAPGTEIRQGLENILRAKTGALIVVGNSKEVLDIKYQVAISVFSSEAISVVNASTVTLRTYVACITNCSDTRRAKGTIEEPFKIHEDVYNLYMANPEFDESNSLIDSMSEYKKNENNPSIDATDENIFNPAIFSEVYPDSTLSVEISGFPSMHRRIKSIDK